MCLRSCQGILIENPKTGDVYHTSSAYLTFVSLNDNGKPKRVDNIIPENDIEICRFKEGKVRHEERKKRLRNDRKQIMLTQGTI